MKKQIRLLSLLAIAAAAVIFLGCENAAAADDAKKATVSGTVTLPASVVDVDYIVIVDTDMDGGNGFTGSATGTVTGTTFDYSIADIPAGDYYIYAVVYASGGDAGGEPVDGDYFGASEITAITAGESKDVDFTLTDMAS